MYITDESGLRALCSTIEGAPVLAVDTEFMRERTYYAKLCLIQVATEDVSAIIDPLAVADLTPLFTVLRDERTMKVLHAGQQDLEIFCLMMGQTVRPVFDTQIAATLAGFPQQVGYGALVKELVGADLDKSDTYTDWARRPLSENQVEYALNDVRYLPEMYRLLRERLEEAGRMPWLAADFERLIDPASYEVDPDQVFRRLKRLSSLNPRQMGIAQKVAAWREREARRRDIPRRWVVGDESLIEIARRAPGNAKALGAVRGVADKLQKSAYPGLLEAVAEGIALEDHELPRLGKRRRRPVDIEGVVDLMA
ncbi:MAG: ribonuclease D, partial [Actinomycetota bacterium]|nr:ribonuclease D [Actinomycetota bacterium]